MIKRLAIRTIVLAVLTVAAFFLMQPITIATGWPEVLQCLKAAAILAWAEHSIMIMRIVMQPRIDVQTSALLAAKTFKLGSGGETPTDPRACAIVYAAHQFTWAARLAAFIILYGVL